MGRSVLIVMLRPTVSDLSEHARAKPPHWYIGLKASIGAENAMLKTPLASKTHRFVEGNRLHMTFLRDQLDSLDVGHVPNDVRN